jgi:hypothetical protein
MDARRKSRRGTHFAATSRNAAAISRKRVVPIPLISRLQEPTAQKCLLLKVGSLASQLASETLKEVQPSGDPMYEGLISGGAGRISEINNTSG